MGWDIYITTLLIFICTVTPLHIAFNIRTRGWCIAYFIFDSFFMIDIFVIFFTSLPETDERDEITDRKEIAINYLSGWFFVDIMAIFPFDLMAAMFFGDFKVCPECDKQCESG